MVHWKQQVPSCVEMCSSGNSDDPPPSSVSPASSLSGCPRALFAKKKAKFPTEDYLSTKFRASDGEMCERRVCMSKPYQTHGLIR